MAVGAAVFVWVSASAITAYLPDGWTFAANVLTNFLGSLGGVFAAFALERRRDDREALKVYLEQLQACEHELGILREQAESIRDKLRPGEVPVSSFEAPIMQVLLGGSGLQRYGTHGLTECLVSLAGHLRLIDNELQHFSFADAVGRSLSAVHVAYVTAQLDQAERVIKYVRGILAEERKRYEHQALVTAEDTHLIDGFMRAGGPRL